MINICIECDQEINNAESSLIWINQGETAWNSIRSQGSNDELSKTNTKKRKNQILNIWIFQSTVIKKKKEKIPLVNIFYPKKSLNTIKTWRQRFSKSPANAMNYVP